jgi:geranylgeranyl diphosphate synthase type II
LGKPIHSDEESGKVTYVTIHGMEQSTAEVERLSNLALDDIQKVQSEAGFVIELVKYLIHRTN